MNFYELFDIPVQPVVSRNSLYKKYIALSRQSHPDYYTGQDQQAQDDALKQAALVNTAYKIFSTPQETLKYYLTYKGVLEEEEKYNLPQDFLMEMMDLNEAVMEVKTGDVDKKVTEQQIENIENEIYEAVQPVLEHISEDTATEEKLLQIKEYYFKKKYLDRLRSQLSEM